MKFSTSTKILLGILIASMLFIVFRDGFNENAINGLHFLGIVGLFFGIILILGLILGLIIKGLIYLYKKINNIPGLKTGVLSNTYIKILGQYGKISIFIIVVIISLLKSGENTKKIYLYGIGIMAIIFILLVIFFAIKVAILQTLQVTYNDGTTGEATPIKGHGHLKDGKIEGQRKIKKSDGEILEGNFHKGLLTGEGQITRPDGNKIIGHFDHGVSEGKTKTVLLNGVTTEGYMIHGLRQGAWSAVIGGFKTIIEFKNNVFNGKAIIELKEGRKLIRKYENGIQIGKDDIRYPTGENIFIKSMKEGSNVIKNDIRWEHGLVIKDVKKDSVVIRFDKIKNGRIEYYSLCYVIGETINEENTNNMAENIYSKGINNKAHSIEIKVRNLRYNTNYSVFIIAIDKDQNIIDITNISTFRTL